MNEIALVLKFWPMIVVVIGGIIWNVRLEAKVLSLQSKVEHEENELDSTQDKMWAKFDNIQVMLMDINRNLTELNTMARMNNFFKKQDQ